MAVLILILIVAALGGGVWWNHRNAGAAIQGVTFVVPHPPSTVADAIHRAHNQGAMAGLRGLMGGMSVQALGPSAFATGSKLGDQGEISVSRDPAGSLVSARALSLYVGSDPRSHRMRFGGVVDDIFTMLGIRPGAAKVKRWQQGLEGRVVKAIARVGA